MLEGPEFVKGPVEGGSGGWADPEVAGSAVAKGVCSRSVGSPGAAGGKSFTSQLEWSIGGTEAEFEPETRFLKGNCISSKRTCLEIKILLVSICKHL